MRTSVPSTSTCCFWKIITTATANALREGLALVREEGLENRWERRRQNHESFVAGMQAMGWSMHVAPGHRLWTLNTAASDHSRARSSASA